MALPEGVIIPQSISPAGQAPRHLMCADQTVLAQIQCAMSDCRTSVTYASRVMRFCQHRHRAGPGGHLPQTRAAPARGDHQARLPPHSTPFIMQWKVCSMQHGSTERLQIFSRHAAAPAHRLKVHFSTAAAPAHRLKCVLTDRQAPFPARERHLLVHVVVASVLHEGMTHLTECPQQGQPRCGGTLLQIALVQLAGVHHLHRGTCSGGQQKVSYTECAATPAGS